MEACHRRIFLLFKLEREMPNIKETTFNPVSMKAKTTNQRDLELFKHSRLSKVVDKKVQ